MGCSTTSSTRSSCVHRSLRKCELNEKWVLQSSSFVDFFPFAISLQSILRLTNPTFPARALSLSLSPVFSLQEGFFLNWYQDKCKNTIFHFSFYSLIYLWPPLRLTTCFSFSFLSLCTCEARFWKVYFFTRKDHDICCEWVREVIRTNPYLPVKKKWWNQSDTNRKKWRK